jgi:hypothetical protein
MGGPRKLAPLRKKAEGSHGQRLFRRADQRQRSIPLQQIEIGVQIVLGGNRIQNKVETGQMLLHLRLVFLNHNFVSADAQRVDNLVWGRCEEHHVGTESAGKFYTSQKYNDWHKTFRPQTLLKLRAR